MLPKHFCQYISTAYRVRAYKTPVVDGTVFFGTSVTFRHKSGYRQITLTVENEVKQMHKMQ
jgi:hypothetical protein